MSLEVNKVNSHVFLKHAGYIQGPKYWKIPPPPHPRGGKYQPMSLGEKISKGGKCKRKGRKGKEKGRKGKENEKRASKRVK